MTKRTVTTQKSLRVMLVLSTIDFERFFGEVLGLDRESYLAGYRNDWSWQYSRILQGAGIEPVIAVRSLGRPELFRTEDGIVVQFLPAGWLWRLWRGQATKAPEEREKSGTGHDEAGKHREARSWAKGLLGSLAARGGPTLAGLRRYVSEAIAVQGSLQGLRNCGADVIYVQEYWTAQFDLIALTSRVPVVAGDHGGSGLHEVKLFKKLAFRRAKWITGQTHDEVAAACEYGARAELLPNPVETDFYCPDQSGPSSARQRTILVVARLTDEQKRISDVVRALTYLADWTLDIIGVGPDREMLAGLAESLGVAERVNFAGFVADRAELRDRYRACGVAVMASAHEARTLAVMEAMACGCAVVVSDIQAFADLAKECGDVIVRFPVGDVWALAEAVESAYEERNVLGRLARNAAVTKLGSEAFGRRLAELLIKAANG